MSSKRKTTVVVQEEKRKRSKIVNDGRDPLPDDLKRLHPRRSKEGSVKGERTARRTERRKRSNKPSELLKNCPPR